MGSLWLCVFQETAWPIPSRIWFQDPARDGVAFCTDQCSHHRALLSYPLNLQRASLPQRTSGQRGIRAYLQVPFVPYLQGLTQYKNSAPPTRTFSPKPEVITTLLHPRPPYLVTPCKDLRFSFRLAWRGMGSAGSEDSRKFR